MLTYGYSSTTGDISDGLGGSMGMLTENLLKINVYFDSLHQKSVTETKDYDWGVSILISKILIWLITFFQGSSMMSALGGVLSLYLGISFAMLFEVVEIFMDFIQNFINFLVGRPLGRKHHLM